TTRVISWTFQGPSPDDEMDIFLTNNDTLVGGIAKRVHVGDQAYNWSVGSPLDNNAPITTADTYRILIRPSHCDSPVAVSTNFFTITEAVVAHAAPPGASIPVGGTIKTIEIAPNESVTLGGAASDGTALVATKGKIPYTYRWSPSDFLDNTALARPNAKPLRTITYTLEVRDSTGTI